MQRAMELTQTGSSSSGETNWPAHVSKATTDRLVMEYLVNHGSKTAVEAFQAESGTAARVDPETIATRQLIHESLGRGDVQRAIECTNKLCPTLLSSEPELHFALQRQQLIELIRANDAFGAIEHAQQHLSPLAAQSEACRADLEQTMLMLVFEDLQQAPEHLRALLSDEQKKATAARLHAAILEAQARDADTSLPLLYRRLQHAQKEVALDEAQEESDRHDHERMSDD